MVKREIVLILQREWLELPLSLAACDAFALVGFAKPRPHCFDLEWFQAAARPLFFVLNVQLFSTENALGF